ncbi:hypothetical protein C8R42DRAFT_718833 [Lentinula raphanica]|nr:hypothetical protein C8R42DRAFT_718833 [Lentinula raphanica]
MSKKRKGFQDIFECNIWAGRKIRNLQSYTPLNFVGLFPSATFHHPLSQHPLSSQQPSSSQQPLSFQQPSSQHLSSLSSSHTDASVPWPPPFSSSSQHTGASVPQHTGASVPPPSQTLDIPDDSQTSVPPSHQLCISPSGCTTPPVLSQNAINRTSSPEHPPLLAAESSSNPQSLGAGSIDHGLTVMASTILNRDINFSRPAGTITFADLDQLAVLAEDAVTANFMDNHGLSTIFDGRQNCTITQASQRLQSLSQSARSYLASLQNLSPTSHPSDVQKTLLDAEQAIAAIGAHLAKCYRKEVQTEVDEAKLVVRNVEDLLKTWRVSHPDNSPMKLDNGAFASNPISSHLTPTLIAYSRALVGRVMEGLGRRVLRPSESELRRSFTRRLDLENP